MQPSLSTLNDLLTYGGFPEPFLPQSEKDSRRWSREYRTSVVREDLADLDKREVDFVIDAGEDLMTKEDIRISPAHLFLSELV